MNFGPYPMSHGLTRLQSRFQADPADLEARAGRIGEALDAERRAARPGHLRARRHRLGRRGPRVPRGARQLLARRLTGMEANLRFVGPETMESKIFSRLTAWQNWIFQRPNAVGEDGALRRYGTGQKAQFDMTRV
jgi:benzoyl-CoA-dihydrodiol lyase